MHIIISHHIISYGTTSGRVPNRANPSVQSRNRSVCAKSRAPTVEIGYAFSRKDLSSPRDRHNPPELRQRQEPGLAPPPPSSARGKNADLPRLPLAIHTLFSFSSFLFFLFSDLQAYRAPPLNLWRFSWPHPESTPFFFIFFFSFFLFFFLFYTV